MKSVRVRKCKSRNSFRFRYKLLPDSRSSADLTIEGIKKMKKIKFSYAPSMTKGDIKKVEKIWEDKL